MKYFRDVVIVAILAVCVITIINSARGWSVNEPLLKSEAASMSAALAKADPVPVTWENFNEFLDTAKVSVRHPFYGEAQRPGDVGYQVFKNDEGAYRWRVTAMGSDRIIYDRGNDF